MFPMKGPADNLHTFTNEVPPYTQELNKSYVLERKRIAFSVTYLFSPLIVK